MSNSEGVKQAEKTRHRRKVGQREIKEVVLALLGGKSVLKSYKTCSLVERWNKAGETPVYCL